MEGVSLAWCGAKGDGIADDAAAIQRAANLAASLNGRVLVPEPKKTYRYASTIEVPDAVKFVGEGQRGPERVVGATFTRSANVVGFRVRGTSVIVDPSGLGRRQFVEFHNIVFRGGNHLETQVEVTATTVGRFKTCSFVETGGRHLLLHEMMDSRFEDCVWDGGGTADGSIPSVELRSGGLIPGDAQNRSYEFTNQIHFDNCRWEAYRGRALSTTGNNTNELFFHSCKMESLASTVPHVRFENAGAIFLNGLNVASWGNTNTAAVMPAQIEFINCSAIEGVLFLEHIGTPGVNGCFLTNFVRWQGSRSIRLHALVYGNPNNITGSTVFASDGQNEATIQVSVAQPPGSTKEIYSGSANIKAQGITLLRRGEPFIGMQNLSVGTDEWQFGRMSADGTGTAFRIFNNRFGADAANGGQVWMLDNAKAMTVFGAIKPAILAAPPPAPREGAFYEDTSVTPNAVRTFSGGAWRRVAYAASTVVPTGTWDQGDLIHHTDVVASGFVGRVCVTGGTTPTFKTFGAVSA